MVGHPHIRYLKGASPGRCGVVLAVMFLGYAATATDGILIAGIGIAISLVIFACGYILSIHSKANIERKRLELQGSEQNK